jgi:triosephosphate isomerase
MRDLVIAGNWKMFKTKDEAVDFIYDIVLKVPSKYKVATVICAPFVDLRALVKRQGPNLRIGAQNMHYLDEGPFTGEVSALMLHSIQVTYVILGHSERRTFYNETDEILNRKIKNALQHELVPILCVGESLETREQGNTNEFIKGQLAKDLESLAPVEVQKIVIAYEPIWAIGTGRTATALMADETMGFIRNEIKTRFGEKTASKIKIIYGGSVNPKNIQELLQQENIDGALIGAASLKVESFLEMVSIASKIKK